MADAFSKLLADTKYEGMHRQRRVRRVLGIPDPIARDGKARQLPEKQEREIIHAAAIDATQFVENEAQNALTVLGREPETISELALDNTLYASKVLNQILKKYDAAIRNSDEIDLKRDRLAADVANATMRTLARVHEVHLRGQSTDRLAQILAEIKELEKDPKG